MGTILRADNLYRFYHTDGEEVLALRGVSMAAAAGEIVAVAGPSGSGKSTLLACLAGVDDPDGGTVSIDGARVSRRPEAERAALRARRIGVLLQSGNLVEHLSVRDNIQFVQRLAGLVDVAFVDALLDRVGLAHRAGHLPAQLSHGEAARAGLAVALANSPVVLLADEPTGELDSASERRVLRLLAERGSEGAAVVVATHSPRVIAAADRVVGLLDGNVTA